MANVFSKILGGGARFERESTRPTDEVDRGDKDLEGLDTTKTETAAKNAGAVVAAAVAVKEIKRAQKEGITPKQEVLELTDGNPQANKLEKNLRNEVKALQRIAALKADPETKIKISVVAAELNRLHMEVTQELRAGRDIPDSKLEEIKHKRSQIESKDPVETSVVLLAKTVVNTADRLSRKEDGTVDEEKFNTKLEEVIEQTEVKDSELAADVESEQEAFDDLKTRLFELFNRSFDAQGLDQAAKDAKFSLVLNALKNQAITTEDIKKEDLESVLFEDKETTEEDEVTREAEIVAEEEIIEETTADETVDILEPVDIDNASYSELTEIIKEKIIEIAETMESSESAAVRKRLEMATPFIDLVLSRSNFTYPVTEDHIDFIYAQFNLLPEQAEARLAATEDPAESLVSEADQDKVEPPKSNISRNYEDAEITREVYKRIVAERNQQLLEQQEVRLQGLEGLANQDENLAKALDGLRQSLDSIKKPVEQAQKIAEFISEHGKDIEADEALKTHLIEEIKGKVIELKKEKEGVEDFAIELSGEVEISLDEESGYHVLTFKNKDDFKNLTQSNGSALGAAYKYGSIYLICNDNVHDIENEGVALEPGPEGNIATRETPSLRSIAHHEIVHLEFDDTRKIHIERETIFAAQKILNIISKEQPGLTPGDKTELFEKIIKSLKTERTDLAAEEIITHDTIAATKIDLLVNNHKQKIKELKAEENDDGRNYLQVEELAAEVNDKMTVSGEKLTLDAIGVGSNETFSIYREIPADEKTYADRGKTSEKNPFNTHNIEAMNMLRIINAAIPENYTEEERQDLVDKWARRLMKFKEFNATNTLAFIFDMVTQDGIELSDKFIPNNIVSTDPESEENKYLKFTHRYKNGSFKYNHVLKLINQGILQGKTPEETQAIIDSVYEIYSSVVLQGFEDTSDIASKQEREVENDLFKFATRPQYDRLRDLHYAEGRVGHPYSAAWPGGINYIMEGLGLKVKDVSEKGLLFKWGKEKNTATGGWERTLRFGYDATLMPVKPWANLPFGMGENSTWVKRFTNLFKKAFGINLINESFTNSHYRKRTGESQLTMNVQDMHSLMAENIPDRLQKTKHYRDPMQIYNMLYDRIGLAHFEGGKITITHEGLTKHRDAYLSRHLYAQTNRAGALLSAPTLTPPWGPPSVEYGIKRHEDLYARGFRGLDLHLLMEAYNEDQVLIDSTGTRTTINARTFPITLGTINERTAERTKMMRFGGDAASKDKDSMDAYIDQGKRFDDISKFIMELQLDSYYKYLADGGDPNDIDKMRLYSMEDVIKAIEKVDNIDPGKADIGTDSVEGFINAKRNATLQFGTKNKSFSRDDLKEYVRCFYYGRTYEAMALGSYGEEQVIRMQNTDPSGTGSTDVFYEVMDGYGIVSDDDKDAKIKDFTEKWNITFADFGKSYDEQKGIVPGAPGSFLTLPASEKINKRNAHREALIEVFKQKGLTFTEIKVTDLPNELRPSVTGGVGPDLIKYNDLFKYKKPGQDISIRLPGQLVPQVVKAKEGLTKEEMNMEFGDFAQNDSALPGPNDPDAFTLKSLEPKLINAVEDVIGEKDQVSAEYFYLRQLMKQAEDYTGKASANKEKWVGRARTAMLLRWIHTGLTIGALVAFPPALAGLLINPVALGILLANYFIIGNWMTRQGDLWGKRKVSGVQATNKLKELEPAFEQAFFDPKFSLGPNRERLYQLLKVAEDVLKGALVTSVDSPNNLWEEVTKITADTGKKMASK